MADDNKLVIKIDGDTSGLEASLKTTSEDTKKFFSQMSEQAKTSGGSFGTNFGKGASTGIDSFKALVAQVSGAVPEKGASAGSAFGTGFGNGAKQGIEAVSGQFRVMEQAAAGNFSAIASSFVSLVANPITLSLAAIGASLAAAFKFSQIGEDLDKTQRRFETLSASAGVVGSTLQAGLKDAAKGLADTSDLTETANKAIVTLGSGAQRLPELFNLAQKAAALFGGDAKSRLDDLTQAIGSLQTRQLKQIGLVVDQEQVFQQYARSLGVAANELTEMQKKQALLNAVLEAGTKQFQNVDAEVGKDSISNGLQRITVGFTDLKEAIAAIAYSSLGQAFGAVLNGAGNALQSFAGFISDAAGIQRPLQEQLEITMQRILELQRAQAQPGASEAFIERNQKEIDVLKVKQQALVDSLEQEKAIAEEKKAQLAAEEEEKPKIQSDADIEKERVRNANIASMRAEARATDLQAEADFQEKLVEIENAGNPNAQAIRDAKVQQQQADANQEYNLAVQNAQKLKTVEEQRAAENLALSKRAAAEKKIVAEKELGDARAVAQAKIQIEQNLWATAFILARNNSELTKALNVAQAIRNTYQGATLALATYPPPFGAIAAATTVALGMAQVAQITGANDGALVTGGEFGKDTEPFMLSKGEIVAPAKSFDEVVEGVARERGFTKDGDGSSDGALIQILNSISEKLDRPHVVVNGDMTADEAFVNRLVDKIRDAVQFRGASLGV